MAAKQAFISFSFLIIFITTSVAQSPAQAPSGTQNHQPSTQASPAQAPTTVPLVQAPPAKRSRVEPTNVTEILDKAGGFSLFIRLLRSTDVITEIENDLNASNTVTILAPTNGGFSALKPGTLNTLSPTQKTHLIDYHVIPTFIALQNFPTLTNPIHTRANSRDYPLNVITDGNSVNISTGVINTTISGTIYSDNQLAIYRVDSVLLPKAIFGPKAISPAPAPAPVPLKPKKEASSSSSSATSASSTGSSLSPSSSSSSKPSSNSTSSSATAAAAAAEPEGPVADESDSTSGVVKSTTGNGVMSVGVAVVAAVFMLSRFDQSA